MYIYDGEKYEKESDIPDLGSWRIMNVDPSTSFNVIMVEYTKTTD